MKKLSYLIVLALILGLVFAGCGDIAKITAPSSTTTEGIASLTRAVTPDYYDQCRPGATEPCINIGDAKFECGQVACCNAEYHYKVDEWGEDGAIMDGTYPHEGNTITISNSSGGYYFDWASKDPVSCVIVKGGPGANVFCYKGAYSDTELYAPLNTNTLDPDDTFEISHVTFCWDKGPEIEETLEVTKTAVTSYTRTHEWSIEKSVDPIEFYLYIDGRGDGTATWTVDVTYEGYVDSDFNVSGTITIKNNGTLDANITDIVDVLEGTQIEITCVEELPYLLEVGETLTCTYSVDGYVEGWNEVTVTTDEGTYDAEDVELIWGEPTTNVHASVEITDTNDTGGVLPQTLYAADYVAGAVETYTYTKDFTWADYGQDACGTHNYQNTAKVMDGELMLDYDTAELDVYVQCYIYEYETAYAKGGSAECFIPTFSNWGWTNPIRPGTYEMGLWAAAGRCDTGKGTLVGSVSVFFNGCVEVEYDVDSPYILDETHVYAGCSKFPKMKVGKKLVDTVAPGQYYNNCPVVGCSSVYVIAQAVVGIPIPDPDFGP